MGPKLKKSNQRTAEALSLPSPSVELLRQKKQRRNEYKPASQERLEERFNEKQNVVSYLTSQKKSFQTF